MKIFLTLCISLLIFVGCRRVDIREVTIEIPSIIESATNKVEKALSVYGGVDKKSFCWDLSAKTLTLRYDSMQIAQTNLRRTIEKTGEKVITPEKTTKKAGH